MQHILNAHCRPGTVLGSGEPLMVSKIITFPTLMVLVAT